MTCGRSTTPTRCAPGSRTGATCRSSRHRLFHHHRLDAVYLDLPLVSPGTALAADHLEALGVSYAGIFPNHRADGDVLRMQSLHRIRITADDVVVASDHGRELLDYVLADLPRDEVVRAGEQHHDGGTSSGSPGIRA